LAETAPIHVWLPASPTHLMFLRRLEALLDLTRFLALQVADYIFGNNMGSEEGKAQGPEKDPDVLDGKKMKGGKGSKIAMTSPVMIEMDQQVLAGEKIKGGAGEKIAMTSPVAIAGDSGSYVSPPRPPTP
jgi:hypothetical protein